MDKAEIKARVTIAYKEAKDYPEFMEKFKPAVQEIIDIYVPSDVTHPWHINRDIEYLREISQARDYKAKGFLMLIVNYIAMIIEAYEKGSDTIDVQVQPDLFNDNTNKEE